MDRWTRQQLAGLGLSPRAELAPGQVPAGLADAVRATAVKIRPGDDRRAALEEAAGHLDSGDLTRARHRLAWAEMALGGLPASRAVHAHLAALAPAKPIPAAQFTAPPPELVRLAALTPQPIGKPGGPGLWKVAGMQLPPYIQHVRDALMKSGHPESQATEMATGIVRDWADGHDGHGHPVSAPVVAQAKSQMAVYDADRAKAKATRSSTMADNGSPTYDADGLDGSWDGDHSDLPDLTGLGPSHFAAAHKSMGGADEPAGGDDASASRAAPPLGAGGRFKNLQSSLAAKGATNPGALAAWIGRKKFGKAKFTKLAAVARKSAGPAGASRSGEMYRTYPLEECRIVRTADGDSSGRVVEAYAAVFGQAAEIHDHEGHYSEEIARTAFDDAIAHAHPDRHGGFWDVTCLYNHGMTVHGTPAERFSLPAGVTRHVSAEGHGLLTRTEYADTPLGEELLELVRMGALRAQSFTGGIIRSDPMLRGPGDKYRARAGVLTRVRRMVLGLREYGLTPFAAYSGAEVLGVRMQLPGDVPDGDDPGFTEYADGAGDDDPGAAGGPPGDGTAARSTGNRLYQLRTEELLRQHGIALDG